MTVLLRGNASRGNLPRTHWPSGWQLWREDKFDGSTGTPFNRWMWARNAEGTANKFRDENITMLPGGGLRLEAKFTDVGGTIEPRSARMASGPQWYQSDEFGRHGLDFHAQTYTPPFLITATCRRVSEDVQTHNGLWLHQPFVKLSLLGAGFPSDPNGRIALEHDGDEFRPRWGKMTMGFHANSFQSAILSGSDTWVPERSKIINQWYDLSYFVDTDTRLGGEKIVTQTVGGAPRSRRLTDYSPTWQAHLAHVWDAPYCVFIQHLAWPGEEVGTLIDTSSYYDVKNFRVWLPPGDARLSEPFSSAIPGWTGAIAPSWPY